MTASPTEKPVLIVEDDAALAARLVSLLEKNQYRVHVAQNGHEALQKAREYNPAFIILDAVLPKMDGFQVARLLKFDSKSKTIPILMLTVLNRSVDRERGKEVGVDRYLTKPFTDEEILLAIHEMI